MASQTASETERMPQEPIAASFPPETGSRFSMRWSRPAIVRHRISFQSFRWSAEIALFPPSACP